MKNIILVGGSGGVGSRLYDSLFKELNGSWNLHSWSSKDCDVRDVDDVAVKFAETSPSVLIYLSVINRDNLIHKQNLGDIQDQLDVNIRGFVYALKYCTDYMRAQKYGRVIYVSSVLSERPLRGTGIYSASKAFGDNLVRTYALENAKYGITANSIQLGYFEGGLSDRVPDAIMEKVIEKIPAQRLGKPGELAKLVNYLIENPYMNGANIPLTSGYENA